MSAHDALMALSAVLTLGGSLFYIVAVLRRKATPRRVTWFGWAAVDTIALVGMLPSGASLNPQIVGCTAAATLVALLSIKRGVPGWARIDSWCAAGTVASAALLWGYPAYGLALSLVTVCIAAIPTYVSAWEDSRREHLLAWSLGTAASIPILLAVPRTFADLAQPIVFLAVNGLVVAIILVRR